MYDRASATIAERSNFVSNTSGQHLVRVHDEEVAAPVLTGTTVAVSDGIGTRTQVRLDGVMAEFYYTEGYVTRHYEYTIEYTIEH